MKTRILIVDDEPDIAHLLALTLHQDGYETSTLHSAEEFKAKAVALNPQLIILDIRLGNADGPTTYNYLLTKGLDKNIPVIFLSGLVPEESRMPAAPGRKYVLHSKPFDYEKLSEDIRLLLNPRPPGVGLSA